MERIQSILKPKESTLKADTNILKKHFNDTPKKVLPSQPHTKQELERFINLFSDKDDVFQLQITSCESVEKFFKTLRNNCFTGYDHIPTSSIKPIADFLIYSVSSILNNFIEVN